ncbi:MAG: SCP2 sterol-binding domain-containing protein [Thermoflexibacter sp.]|jgi:putative sterol carrier protein|nr:SCP2 sterol-binding domain-containing protein [Thermoflexibacter sp.]
MTLQEFTEKVRTIASNASNLKGSVKFSMNEGVVFIDNTQQPYTVSNENKDASCTISISLDDAVKLMNGELNPAAAFMFGKLKVSGDVGVAMQIAQIIGK